MVNARSISRLKKIDWDFAGAQSESAFSALHWHPCRFVSQIPAAFIGTLTEPGDIVLDPFTGSGTTLVEAQRLGRHALGIDVNPIACMASRAKTAPVLCGTISKWVGDLELSMRDALSGGLLSGAKLRNPAPVPESVQSTKWYTRKVAADLAALWRSVNLERGQKKILAQAAFSAILLKVCRETRHWGYVCDNTTPKSNHEGDVAEEYKSVLDGYAAAYAERDNDLLMRFGEAYEPSTVEVHCGDARKKLRECAKDSVDLVVTSPPYFGVSDYIKAQRLSMEWFGNEIEALRRIEVGARSKRHRDTALEDYLVEIGEVFSLLKRCLKPGAACVVVIGESSARAPYISKFVEVMRSCGFDILHSAVRRISAQRRLTPSILHEEVLTLGA